MRSWLSEHWREIAALVVATAIFSAATALTGSLVAGGFASGVAGQVFAEMLAGRTPGVADALLQGALAAGVTVATLGLGRFLPAFEVRGALARTAASSTVGAAFGAGAAAASNAVQGRPVREGVADQALLGAVAGALVEPSTRFVPGSYLRDKEALLARLGRSPSSITEGFVAARGSVAGEPIDERSLFFQRWEPTAPDSGRVVAVFPGYAQTGRSFADRIQALSARGDLVYVFDQQWAGLTRGVSPGGVDRGYGIVRDVAAGLAFVARAEPGRTLVPFGNSLGGGGVLGALLLNDLGRIRLEGPAMPTGLSAVVQNAWLAPTRNIQNGLLELATRLGAGSREVPAELILPFACDPATRARCAALVRAESVKVQAGTIARVREDFESLVALVAGGERPRGRVVFLHGDRDAVADAEATREVARALGAGGEFVALPGGLHGDARPETWDAVSRAIANAKASPTPGLVNRIGR